MDELKRSVDYSRKRLQAIRNCEDHVADILWKSTQKIIAASKRYRGAGRLTNESALLSYAKNVTADAEESINSYISAYSKVSCKILGIDNENIESFLVSDIYGKTTSERNAVYLGNFAEDIVRMIKAGTLMGYSDQQLLSSIRTGYKDPYHTSVITKAKRKDINIDGPSYGKGYYKNAYPNTASPSTITVTGIKEPLPVMHCGADSLAQYKIGQTITLLLTSEGKKMGKTQAGAVWLDPEKTSPYDFYQYWRNIGDADVLKCLRMLTFLPLEQIDEMDKWEGAQLNQAKEILAFELTKLVHSEEEAQKAQDAARALFSQGGDRSNMPSAALSAGDLTDGQISVVDLMVKGGLAPSKGEARRLIQQGGVEIDGAKVTDTAAQISAQALGGEGVTVKKGKKTFLKVTLA